MLLKVITISSFFLAVGEPPLCMSSSVLFAIKRAVESARQDAGNDQPFTLCKSTISWPMYMHAIIFLLILAAPATVEATQQACLVDPSKFLF